MKKYLFISILIIVTVFITGCFEDNRTDQSKAEKDQASLTNEMLAEADRQIGMPDIVNFQQKKLMKLVYEMSDQENLVCYAYIKSDYQGKLFFIGKCLGYGVPFSAQFTNPVKLVRADMGSSYGETAIPQADPNALYMPTSSSATWLLMLDKEGKGRPVYFEPEIVVSPFPLN